MKIRYSVTISSTYSMACPCGWSTGDRRWRVVAVHVALWHAYRKHRGDEPFLTWLFGPERWRKPLRLLWASIRGRG